MFFCFWLVILPVPFSFITLWRWVIHGQPCFLKEHSFKKEKKKLPFSIKTNRITTPLMPIKQNNGRSLNLSSYMISITHQCNYSINRKHQYNFFLIFFPELLCVLSMPISISSDFIRINSKFSSKKNKFPNLFP